MLFYKMAGKSQTAMLILGAVMVLAGIFSYKYYVNQNQTAPPSTSGITAKTIIGQRRPDFSMVDTEDQRRSMSEWDGKVVLVNFWATWCPPCRREIPAFIKLQEDYRDKGLAIVGIALDTQQAAVDFVDPMGINYPILVGETEGIELTQDYGNELGVLPYSVIVDKKGIIQKTFRHEVSYEEAEALIKPYL